MTQILSVSVPDELKKKIDELELSPSAILQRAIREIVDVSTALKAQNERLVDNMGKFRRDLEKALDFLEQKGLFNDFQIWRNQNV